MVSGTQSLQMYSAAAACKGKTPRPGIDSIHAWHPGYSAPSGRRGTATRTVDSATTLTPSTLTRQPGILQNHQSPRLFTPSSLPASILSRTPAAAAPVEPIRPRGMGGSPGRSPPQSRAQPPSVQAHARHRRVAQSARDAWSAPLYALSHSTTVQKRAKVEVSFWHV